MTAPLPAASRLVDLYLRLSNADETADSLKRQEALPDANALIGEWPA